MLNNFTVEGRIGNDIESKVTQGGKNFIKLRIACRRDFPKNNGQQDNNGNKEYETDWFSIVAFGKLAEYCANKLSKGDRIIAMGRVQVSQNQGQDGKTYTNFDLMADKVYPVEVRKSNDNSGGGFAPAQDQFTGGQQGVPFGQPAPSNNGYQQQPQGFQPQQQQAPMYAPNNGFNNPNNFAQQPVQSNFGAPQQQQQQNFGGGFGAPQQQPQTGFYPQNNFNSPTNFGAPQTNFGGK